MKRSVSVLSSGYTREEHSKGVLSQISWLASGFPAALAKLASLLASANNVRQALYTAIAKLRFALKRTLGVRHVT
jgi:hypothetical protein